VLGGKAPGAASPGQPPSQSGSPILNVLRQMLWRVHDHTGRVCPGRAHQVAPPTGLSAAVDLDDGAVYGQRRISADTALRLARFFGICERFWINLQARYDLETEKDRLGDALGGIRPLSAAS
jgi:addiction module HigA family antidote